MGRKSSRAAFDVFLCMITRVLEKQSIIMRIFCLPILLALFIPFSSHFVDAAEVKVTPKITVSGSYNDNIFFTSHDKVSSSIVTTSPGLDVDYETLLSKLSLNADVDILKYLDESDLDRNNQYYRLSGEHQFQERWTTSANFNYFRDTTLNSYLQETGRAIDRVQRDFLEADGRVSYAISQMTGISTHYRYQNAKYEDNVFSDYDSHYATLNLYHNLKNERDKLTIGPSYYHRSSDVSDLDAIALNLGWNRDWTEITKSKASIGARHTNVEKDDGTTNDNWGARASLAITSTGLASMTTFQYFHDLRTTVDGEDVNVDNIYFDYSHLFTERFGAGIDGRLVFSYKLYSQQSNINDTRLYWVEPRLFYRLTENLNLSLRYRYQNNVEMRDEGDVTRERNTVWLQLGYGLPFFL
jgi:hypothetical protein